MYQCQLCGTFCESKKNKVGRPYKYCKECAYIVNIQKTIELAKLKYTGYDKQYYQDNKKRQQSNLEKYMRKLRIKSLIIMGGYCEICRDLSRRAYIHHIYYPYGKESNFKIYKRIVDGDIYALQLLCNGCHKKYHRKCK
jgi:hypothetical protein